MKKFIALFALMVITLASYAQVYKMYNTRNYHNQLRLNTMTGNIVLNKFRRQCNEQRHRASQKSH